MKKSNRHSSSKGYFQSVLQAEKDVLIRNPSRGEQTLFIFLVLFSLLALVFNAIYAIILKNAVEITKAFTVNIIMFLLIVLLTVSDRVMVFRGVSVVALIHSFAVLIQDCFTFAEVSGTGIALAVIGLIADLALYGTIIFDQFNSADRPYKYWLIYSGALYKLLYLIVSVIVQGNKATSLGVFYVLRIAFLGIASICIILTVVDHFDGFSFIRYFFHEISGTDDGEDNADKENVQDVRNCAEDKNSEHVPYGTDEKEETLAEENSGNTSEKTEDEEVIDDFGYVPYDDDSDNTESVDSSVKPLSEAPENGSADDNDGAYKEYVLESNDSSDDVLIDESVMDERNDGQAAVSETEEQTDESVSEENENLTPTEIKYARFALTYHKPDDILQVEGLAGDMFDVWVDGDIICFQNDLDQATEGRGVRTAAIPFADVRDIGIRKYSNGSECIALSYLHDGEVIEIGFTKRSFINFKRVMLECGDK